VRNQQALKKMHCSCVLTRQLCCKARQSKSAKFFFTMPQNSEMSSRMKTYSVERFAIPWPKLCAWYTSVYVWTSQGKVEVWGGTKISQPLPLPLCTLPLTSGGLPLPLRILTLQLLSI
jgi:hypothetical protein